MIPWGAILAPKVTQREFFVFFVPVPFLTHVRWSPLGAQSGPKGPPRVAQGPQKAPQGRPRDPQKAPRGCPRDPKGTPYDPFCDSLLLSCCFLAYGLLFLASGLLVLAYRLMFFCSSVTGMLLTCPLAICVAHTYLALPKLARRNARSD